MINLESCCLDFTELWKIPMWKSGWVAITTLLNMSNKHIANLHKVQIKMKTKTRQMNYIRHLNQSPHSDSWYLTELHQWLVSNLMKSFRDTFTQQVNLNIIFTISAWKYHTRALQNSWLALFHLSNSNPENHMQCEHFLKLFSSSLTHKRPVQCYWRGDPRTGRAFS